MSKAVTFHISCPTGDPQGLRIIEKPPWAGCGLFFSRSDYHNASKRKELSGEGVYLLWRLGVVPPLYVGQGKLRSRLNSHGNDKKKDFWEMTVAFTSKGQNLNKAHLQYLEAELLRRAAQGRRCQLDQNTPNPSRLAEADTNIANVFLDEMLQCLAILGVNFFEKPQTNDQDLFLKAKNIAARGREDGKRFVVRAGSQAVKDEAPSIPANLSTLRKTLLSEDLLVEDGGVYRLVQDCPFNSPSTASGVLLGTASNGREAWKDDKGRSLKALQDAGTKVAAQ